MLLSSNPLENIKIAYLICLIIPPSYVLGNKFNCDLAFIIYALLPIHSFMDSNGYSCPMCLS